MKKIYRYLGCIGLCLLSFYYTDKVANYVKGKNPIYQEINSLKDTVSTNSIDCIIEDEYIIPGLSGKVLNVDKSFTNMHKEYNEELLVFDYIKPNISINDNKDKIIKRGNSKKNSISIIFDSVNELSTYMILNNYQVNLLINKENYNTKYEMINDSNIETTYNNIEKYLNKNNLNKNLCLVNNTISPLCNNKYLFKPSLIINHSNLSTTINKISSGEIIRIENSISKEELNVILQQVKYQNLKVVYLSKLISETN